MLFGTRGCTLSLVVTAEKADCFCCKGLLIKNIFLSDPKRSVLFLCNYKYRSYNPHNWRRGAWLQSLSDEKFTREPTKDEEVVFPRWLRIGILQA